LLKDWQTELSGKDASGYAPDVIKSLRGLLVAVCLGESGKRRERRASSFYRLISEDPALSESELGKRTIELFSDYAKNHPN
jgi:hypothetical protein